ncbi:MAG TPA: GDSL-type esterase/lipase family protein [Candidatus Binatia bacterium]|nr:GDSL-type esterase/lipase family protein [Candidatus Binatia bacterium]
MAALETIGRLLPTERLPGILPTVVQAMRLHGNTFYRQDDDFRYITAAGLDLEVRHPEFTYHVKTKLNLGPVGFRGGTRGGSVWGVAVGDSFTFGMGVEHDWTWVAILSKRSGREIINLGVPGWGPQQYTLAVERYGLMLHPKVIFYGIYRNDLQDGLLFDEWLRDSKYKRMVESFLRTHSITYNLFRLQGADLISEKQNFQLRGSGIQFDRTSLQTSLKKERKTFALAWSVMKREIELALSASRKAGADFVLLYLPAKLETYWELAKSRDVSLEAFEKDVEMLRTQLADFCRAERMLCLDLTPALRARASGKTRLYYSSDAHWTEAGNRVVADEIHQFALANALYR